VEKVVKKWAFLYSRVGKRLKYFVSERRTVIRNSFTLLPLFYKGRYFDIRQSSCSNFCCCPYTSKHHVKLYIVAIWI